MKKWIFAAAAMLVTATSFAAVTKYYYGWRVDSTGGDHTCMALSSGVIVQHCIYPSKKTVLFRVTGNGMTNNQITLFSQLIDDYNNNWVTQFSGLALGRTNGTNWDMRIDFGSVPDGDPSLINHYVDAYCILAGSWYGEPTGGHMGAHKPCYKMQLTIDYNKIVAAYPDSAQSYNVLRHALAGGMMHGIGLGWIWDHMDRWTSIYVTPFNNKNSTIPAKEVCRVNSWDPADDTILYAHDPHSC
jgi:hypothetical protein